MKFRYGIDRLNVELIQDIANANIDTELCDLAKEKIRASRMNVEQMAKSKKTIYGINTGFGSLCDTKISPSETNILQKNLFAWIQYPIIEII